MKDSAAPLQSVLYGANLCPVAELLTLEFDSAQTWVSDAGVSTTTSAEADGRHRIRWAEGKSDVSFGGETWKTGGPGIEIVDRARVSTGMQIDDLGIALHGGSVTLNGKTLPANGHEKLLDGVRVTWLRAYYAADGSVAGVVEMFGGTLEDPEPSSTTLRATVKSVLSQIEASIPWRPIQPSCPYLLGDDDCGANPALGTCDYTLGTCIATFNNGARFGGCPYQPLEDSV